MAVEWCTDTSTGCSATREEDCFGDCSKSVPHPRSLDGRIGSVYGSPFIDHQPFQLLSALHPYLAALLHDMLDKKYVGAELASDPYAFFEPFFKSMADLHGVDLLADGRARLIADVVDNVSWTTESKLHAAGKWTEWHQTCRELHCVQDADRLDAIGAFGAILRDPLHLFAFSFSHNDPRCYALRCVHHESE